MIEVLHGRKHKDAVHLLEQFPKDCRRIKAVVMDMCDARSFADYRVRILLHGSRLNLNPAAAHRSTPRARKACLL
jgi:hypothetical protein